jgi:hypothetical protein
VRLPFFGVFRRGKKSELDEIVRQSDRVEVLLGKALLYYIGKVVEGSRPAGPVPGEPPPAGE